jgi:hypothetical protein
VYVAKTKLILFVDVNEDALPKGSPYTDLPDQLYGAIADTLPHDALELSSLYLTNPKQSVEKEVLSFVLNYHHYAVNVRGEPCGEKDCEQHQHQNVLSFHDHKNRNNPPPGVN